MNVGIPFWVSKRNPGFIYGRQVKSSWTYYIYGREVLFCKRQTKSSKSLHNNPLRILFSSFKKNINLQLEIKEFLAVFYPHWYQRQVVTKSLLVSLFLTVVMKVAISISIVLPRVEKLYCISAPDRKFWKYLWNFQPMDVLVAVSVKIFWSFVQHQMLQIWYSLFLFLRVVP